MRAIWKGSVSFGLVNVPVKLYSATESHDVSFRQVHAKDGGRIKYQRVCSIDGEEIAYADIAKGYETEDGEMVILTDDDMADLPVTSSREIAVEKFVPSDQIDPMLLEKSYYLEPEKTGAKPYALLRQALLDADRMAVVTVALRQRTTIAVLRVKDDVIVLQTMMWPDEIRHAGLLDRLRRGEGRRGQDGPHAGGHAGRRLRRLGVRGRLRRGRAGAREGQDRGRRDQEDADLDQVLRRGRRPAGRAAEVGGGRQDRPRRVRGRVRDAKKKPAKKTAKKAAKKKAS